MEVTRRVNRCNIWQAIYTAGVTLPTPFGSAQYFHRNLNPKKTVEVGFAYKPASKTMAAFVKQHRLPEEPLLRGIRPLVDTDVPAVAKLLNNHLSSCYKVHMDFTPDEVAHWVLPRDNVVYSYVVEDDNGRVTDLLSFYELNSSILKNPNYNKMNIAYASYCVARDNDAGRLKQLFKDMLILAKQKGFDVFNVTEVL